MSEATITFPRTMIRASAGSGKTFQLSNRFLGLVCSGQRSDHILAATFARKAAGEIIDRIVSRLAEAALDDQKLADLARHLGQANFSQHSLDRQRCLDILRTLLANLHRLRIGTLDRFFIQMAGAFSLELGLPPGWQIVDELDDQALRDEGVRRLLDSSTADTKTLLHLLGKGAASRAVAEEIHAIVGSLYEVYGETTAAAWHTLKRPPTLDFAELQDAVEALAAWNDFPTKQFADKRNGDLENARSEDWESFISKGLAGAIASGEGRFNRREIDPPLQACYEPIIKHAKGVLVGQLVNQNEATHKLLARFEAIYEELKIAEQALRFDDVTRRLARGIAAGEIGETAYRLDAQIEHLLLDEFQDTSLAQWGVVGPLAEEVVSHPRNSFFCVGDVKQAIYGWRGGVSELFDAAKERLGQLEELSLDESYRSSPVIIDTVNDVFGSLPTNEAIVNLPDVQTLWRERFTRHRTAKATAPGYARLLVAPAAAGDEKESQASVTLQCAADEIARLAAEAPGRSIGVLARKNITVAKLIYELSRRNIAASEEGGNPLTDSTAVQIILSLLTIADHPGDLAARFHVANSPLAEEAKLTDHRDDAAAQALSRSLRASLVNRGYGPTIYRWVKILAARCDQRDVSRLLQLVELAYGYEDRASLRVDAFRALVERRKVEDPTSAPVRVMTVHQSKGLEFDIVVLAELDQNLKPQPPAFVVGRRRPIDPIDRVCRYVNEATQALLPGPIREMFAAWPNQVTNESLCLLYVAMTRAAHELHMIVAPSKPSEKTIPKSFAGVLRAALAPGQLAAPRKILWERGDSRALRSAAPRVLAATVAGQPPVEPVAIRLRDDAGAGRRLLERRSPTSLQGGARVDLARRLDSSPAAKARGLLWHAWLGEIEWLDEKTPLDLRRLRAIGEAQAVGGKLLQTELAKFEKLLAQPLVRAALSRPTGAAEVKVWREWPFVVRDGDAIVEGRIDRLVVFSQNGEPERAEIVDFKSDYLARPEEAAEKGEFYLPQLEAYRRGVARRTGLSLAKIDCRLLFLTGPSEWRAPGATEAASE